MILILIIITAIMFIFLCCYLKQSIFIFFICFIKSSISAWNDIITIIISAFFKHFNVMNNKFLFSFIDSIIINNICFFSIVFKASFYFKDWNNIVFYFNICCIVFCIFAASIFSCWIVFLSFKALLSKLHFLCFND